jgi:hypothetical protein
MIWTLIVQRFSNILFIGVPALLNTEKQKDRPPVNY